MTTLVDWKYDLMKGNVQRMTSFLLLFLLLIHSTRSSVQRRLQSPGGVRSPSADGTEFDELCLNRGISRKQINSIHSLTKSHLLFPDDETASSAAALIHWSRRTTGVGGWMGLDLGATLVCQSDPTWCKSDPKSTSSQRLVPTTT